MVDRLRREALLVAEETIAGEALLQRVVDVVADSREVRDGTLFCAIPGTVADGHRFLEDAARRGALAALVERPDSALPLLQIVVGDGRRAAAFAAADAWAHPSEELTLIGVTGTNGKTTTVGILRHLLGTRGAAASLGTLGAIGGDGNTIPGTEGLTTPGPTEVARLLRHLVDQGIRTVAMEVSSHALEQHRVAALRFDAGVFTNLSREHLDYHGDMDAYRRAKLRLLELLAPGGTAVVNTDDPAWREVDSHGFRKVLFGIQHPADIRAEDIVVGEEGMRWRLRTPSGSAPVRLPLWGSYNVANALAAAAALWSLGWQTAEIAEALDTVPQVPGRLERVQGNGKGDPLVLIDYAHTPDALERALAAIRPLTRGRLIVVFGAGGDRDRGKRPEMGRIAAAGADLSIVTSDNPRTEDPGRIVDAIETGMGNAPRLRILDRREAIERAIGEATERDVVLLAGKGHETYQIRGAERRPFDERIIVQEILANRASPRS